MASNVTSVSNTDSEPSIPDHATTTRLYKCLIELMNERGHYISPANEAHRVQERLLPFLRLVTVVHRLSPIPRSIIDWNRLEDALPIIVRRLNTCEVLEKAVIASYSPEHPDNVAYQQALVQDALDLHSKLFSIIKEACTHEHQLAHNYAPGSAPVYGLPDEILHEIFLLCFWATPRFRPRDSLRPVSLALRSVCTRWRSIADSMPALWSNVDASRGGQYALNAVKRSTSLAIRFKFDNGHISSLLFNYTTKTQDRTRSLDLTVNSADDGALQCLVSFPFPQLQEVTIGFEGRIGQVLSVETFRDAAPASLTKLNLKYTNIVHTSPVFDHPLVQLSLFNCCPWDTLDAVFHALASLSTLKDFAWQMTDMSALRSLPMAQPSDSSGGSISLPNLSSLKIVDDAYRALALLDRLALPESTEISVGLDCTVIQTADHHGELMTEIHRVFGERANILTRTRNQLATLVLSKWRLPAKRNFVFGFTTVYKDPADSRGPARWEFAMYDLCASIVEDATPLLDTLSLSPAYLVKHLVVDGEHLHLDPSSTSYERVLARLMGVETIELMGHGSDRFLHPLRQNKELLPKLKKVVLRGAIVRDIANILSAIASQRQTSIEIEIFQCDLQEARASTLRDAVVESGGSFYWDGFEDAASILHPPCIF